MLCGSITMAWRVSQVPDGGDGLPIWRVADWMNSRG